MRVAVRSSATAEDLEDASFAGQQETYLNVISEKALLDKVKKYYASLLGSRGMSYREVLSYFFRLIFTLNSLIPPQYDV